MQLQELYRIYAGCEPESVTPLTPAGSNRRYFRLCGPRTLVGVVGTDREENEAFIYLSQHFSSLGLPVPEVLAVSDDGMEYLVTDLGDVSLFSMIGDESMVGKAMRALARLHCIGSQGLDYSKCFPVESFDERAVMWDLNYFKYEFLKPSGIDFDEEALENDFERLASRIMDSSGEASGFMYRDFQSRNIMVTDGKPYFIDFQGGRVGPSLYDAVSFLWQAKAGFSDEFRYRMLEVYAGEYGRIKNMSAEKMIADAPLFALFRTLQVLGAYGLCGLVEKKAHFLESIPMALENLSNLLRSRVIDAYPELKSAAERLIADERFTIKEKKDYLTIKVFSFSYKKGYPSDYSGNGGGFMFDCRGMHNPGRYAEYKTLTGLDRPVIDFLKEKGETDLFSERAFELVKPTVERYVKRGFTSLQIGFGCTGGQHRSVYCAEAVSKKLAAAFPTAVVEVCHREQRIEKVYNGKTGEGK